MKTTPFFFAFVACPLLAIAAGTAWPGGETGVMPGQDFYAHANGAWQRDAVIAPDRAGTSIATQLVQDTESKLRELLQSAASDVSSQPSDEAGKVGAYYAAFLDEPRIETLHAAPLKPALAAIRAANDRPALARLMGAANATFHGSVFALSIEPDSHASNRYAVTLGQGGLGLPSPEAYRSASSAALRDAYRTAIERQLALVGWPEPADAARRVLAFETSIAERSWSASDQRDESKNHRVVGRDELTGLAPRFPWRDYWKGAGLDPAQVVLSQDTAIAALADRFVDTPLDDLRAWATFHLVDNAAPDLSSGFFAAWFDLHGRAVNGATEAPPRWRQALKQVAGGGSKDLANSRGAMGDAVGRLYVARWFDPSADARLRTMTDQLKATLRSRIGLAPWMSATAKAEALRKVDAYRIEIGNAAETDRYDELVIRRDDLFGDVERASAHAWARDRERLGRPVDSHEWFMTPQTVNAYNYAPFSVIVFTAALLQPPAFDASQDAALAYGGIGAIIGHELTHAFDDVGRTYDHTGHHRDWWTAADHTRFDAMSAGLVRQFDGCEALPGLHVDGRLTLGENLADIGGLQLAFEAYHAALAGQPAPAIGGLSGDQRFFLGFALLRREKRRPEAVRTDLRSDPHTPGACRVNQDVRNIDGWYDAFRIGPADALYLPPEQRTRIW